MYTKLGDSTEARENYIQSMRKIETSIRRSCPRGIALYPQMPTSENSSCLLRGEKNLGLSGRYKGRTMKDVVCKPEGLECLPHFPLDVMENGWRRKINQWEEHVHRTEVLPKQDNSSRITLRRIGSEQGTIRKPLLTQGVMSFNNRQRENRVQIEGDRSPWMW